MIARRFPENLATNPANDGVMELSLMISHAQFAVLEKAAQAAQMTVAQYLRRLLQCSLAGANADNSR